MSFLEIDGKFIGFINFCTLSESIKPRETHFKPWVRDGDSYITRLEHDNIQFAVFIEHKTGTNWCEIAFAQLKPGKNPDIYDTDHYTMSEKIPVKNAIQVFNKVLYVSLEWLKQHTDIKEINFQAGSPSLNHMYSMMVKNKFLLSSLAEHGITYSGNNEHFYIFERK